MTPRRRASGHGAELSRVCVNAAFRYLFLAFHFVFTKSYPMAAPIAPHIMPRSPARVLRSGLLPFSQMYTRRKTNAPESASHTRRANLRICIFSSQIRISHTADFERCLKNVTNPKWNSKLSGGSSDTIPADLSPYNSFAIVETEILQRSDSLSRKPFVA